MPLNLIKRLLGAAALCLVQALVFNRIHLFGCATPLLYIYMVLTFPHDYPRWGVMLWGFLLGLTVDTFSNTPGVASASLTLVAAIQPGFFNLFLQRDAPEDTVPSAGTMGMAKFAFYATVLVLLYCLCFFTLEMFCFFHWVHWLKCIGGSTLLTLILILTIESVRKK